MNANAPFSAVVSAAAVGLYDHSIVLCGGQSNGSYLNEVWLSEDVGRTWTLQQSSAPWSARYAHSLAVDGDDIIYLVGGSAGSATPAPLDVWLSNTKGASWSPLQLSTASSSVSVPSSVLYGCSFVRELQSAGVRQLVLYSGEDATGAAVGVIAANLSLSGVAPASSTAIPLSSSAGATAKPALPSSTAAAATSASTGTSSAQGATSSASTTSSTATGSSSSSSSSTGTQTNGSTRRHTASLAAFIVSCVVAAVSSS